MPPNFTTVKMPAGWNIRVTSFDSERKPRIVRNFLAYEADRETGIKLVRKRVRAGRSCRGSERKRICGPGMRPGDVRRLGRKSDFDEVQLPCDVLRFCEGGRDWPEPDSRGHPNGSPTSYRQPLFLLALAMGSSGDRTIFASRVSFAAPFLLVGFRSARVTEPF